MVKALLIFVGLLLTAGSDKSFAQNESVTAQARNLTIRLDFESAKAIIDLLGQKTVTDKALDDVAHMYGSQQLIRKVTSYDKDGTEEQFKQTLREVIQTGTVKANDPFDWKAVKARQFAIQSLIRQIDLKQDAFLADINREITPYTPTDLKADVRACFLVGGGSLGFTIGNDNTFNVALQKIGDDYEGLIKLVAHELYHSVQHVGDQNRKKGKAMDPDPPKHIISAYIMLANLYAEGTANLVGDFSKVEKPKLFTKVQQDEYALNRQRNRTNFTLFESLLYRAYHDSTASPDALYNVAFTTAFEETSYYVGYEMAKFIEKHEGRSAVASFVAKSSIEFSQHYIDMYRKHDEKGVVKFSKPIEAIIKAMQPWQDKL